MKFDRIVKKQTKTLTLVVVILLVLSLGISYAFYMKTSSNKTDQVVTSGTLEINYGSTNGYISNNSYPDILPMSDSEGLLQTGYTFTVKNNGNLPVAYQVYLYVNEAGYNQDSPEGTLLTDLSKLKYNLTTNSAQNTSSYRITDLASKEESGITKYKLKEEQVINSNQTNTHVLRLWLGEDIDSSLVGKYIYLKIEVQSYVNGQQQELAGDYHESILNGADPVLTSELVPVTIENDGTVKKADLDTNWYSYENKEWANAVILASGNEDNYKPGDTIEENKIESYFVWIPKYKYKLFHTTQADGYTTGQPETLGSDAKEIEIEFGLTNTTDSETECVTPMTSGGSGNCADGKFMTHPAFISMNTNGLWVAKFETTGTTSGITVKPNTTSLRNQTVKTFFELSYNYKQVNNAHNEELDPHMMKNTEWGAVSYLYHSKYGRCTNGVCEDIRINNNSSYLTGYAAVDGTDQSSYPGTYGTDASKTLTYNTSTGYKASTTGNITGVYDMSGGAHEYMASYRANTFGGSTFDATSIANYNSKYFDVYVENSGWTSHSKRILGDATGEMGPFYYYADGDTSVRQHNNWYADISYFVYSSSPWFGRGGSFSHGVLAGPFLFGHDTGGALGSLGFRLVLAP
ncbi:MAG: hypothetical protein E7158_05915 [Firmicutes bacterium]|nr:hypothetical protein [Bacillota bacterium]